jgi:2-haloacid dehalogenase
MHPIKAIVFDAYGTLFDVRSANQGIERLFPGKGEAVGDLWRRKQLEYTWLRSLMGRYRDFWSVTNDALVYALETYRLPAGAEIRAPLLREYLVLQPFPEVPSILHRLRPRTLGILSNGTPGMLHAMVNHAGLGSYFAAVLSVDPVRIYKPFMGVYQLAPAVLGVRKENILYVSGNAWDAAGAKTFGFQVCWVHRSDAPFDRLDAVPDLTVSSLDQLSALLAGCNL